MPISSVKTVNFGKTKKGLITVGYTLYDSFGVLASARTDDVYELGNETGIYAANVSFPDNFTGAILWDTGQGTDTVYATEEQNNTDSAASLTEDITLIKSSIDADLTFVKDMISGRWCIDPVATQMIFYKGDNTTEVARYDLKDKNDNPSYLSVFKRNRVS